MNSNIKKIFSVALALAVGSGIVLFAWKGGTIVRTEVSTETTAKNDEWKNTLHIIPEASTSKLLGSQKTFSGDTNNTIAEDDITTTDLFARKLLVNYALTQGSMATTTWSDADADALAQSLIKNIDLPQIKQYATKDLNISNDNSDTAFALYGEKLNQILQSLSFKKGSGVVTIFTDALYSSEPKKLDELTTIVAKYSNVKKSLLAMETPSGIAPIHLRLLQFYTNIEAYIISMQKLFNDPVQGLYGFTQFKEEYGSDLLVSIGKDYQNYSPPSNNESINNI
ncbi:MAG TPA: hypothetical protein DCS23_00115 [Candidatus Yonathbacteria bacterium]|nr:hypothetical protein [Candidatus Yonathbacteria bacterium]